MRMKHALIAASLLALWYGVGGVGALREGAAAEPVVGAGAATESGPVGAEAGAATQAVPATDSAAVGSNLDKINYSLGFELGEDLKRDNLELVPEVLLKGVTDALSGGKPQVKTSQRRAALAEIKAKRAEENLALSQAFLADNAKKEGITTLESGLQYRELRAGEGKTPTNDSRVTVNYRGTLIDGSEFDNSYARGKPATLDVRRVIKGWREGLQLMKEGAKWELYVPSELGYGKGGRDKRIPPNSALIFEVELLAVEPAPPPREGAGPAVPPDGSDE